MGGYFMKKLAGLLALAAAMGCFVSPVRAAELPPLLQGVRRIATMGASITQFAARPGGYVWLLQHTLDALYPDSHIQVVDVGISGNTSGDMVRRFKKDVLAGHYDLVTIKEGYNDLTRRFSGHPDGDGPDGADAAQYTKNMATMVAEARKSGMKVLIMTPTIYEDQPDSVHNEKLKAYVTGIQDLAAREKVPLADVNTALTDAWQKELQGKHRRLTTDGVHLTALGDAVLARCLMLGLGIPAADLDAVQARVEAEATKGPGPI
jgi:lysophospholipase L1-like esterase